MALWKAERCSGSSRNRELGPMKFRRDGDGIISGHFGGSRRESGSGNFLRDGEKNIPDHKVDSATVRRGLRNFCATAQKYLWATRGASLLQSAGMSALLRGTRRFLRYSVVGTSTFALDLALLFVFTDFLGIYYVFSAGLAFAVAVSVNYLFARSHVFPETEREFKTGYGLFMLIAGTGLLAVMGLMYLAVDVLGFGYIVSRIAIAGFVGLWSYFMNFHFNFKVVGEK